MRCSKKYGELYKEMARNERSNLLWILDQVHTLSGNSLEPDSPSTLHLITSNLHHVPFAFNDLKICL